MIDIYIYISMLLLSQHYVLCKTYCLIMCEQIDKITTGESTANEVGRITFYTYFIKMEIKVYHSGKH